jgi:hypothetical protein
LVNGRSNKVVNIASTKMMKESLRRGHLHPPSHLGMTLTYVVSLTPGC